MDRDAWIDARRSAVADRCMFAVGVPQICSAVGNAAEAATNAMRLLAGIAVHSRRKPTCRAPQIATSYFAPKLGDHGGCDGAPSCALCLPSAPPHGLQFHPAHPSRTR